jgi:Uma2 family endonuclease
LQCEAAIDGVGVRVDDRTMYIPDVIVRCGPREPGESRELNDPVILVEVVSPLTQSIDSVAKLRGYFQPPSLRRYLIVAPEARAVVHHHRTVVSEIESRLEHSTRALVPPGLTVEVGAFFASM